MEDKFWQYIQTEVNPEREKNGLNPMDYQEACECERIITTFLDKLDKQKQKKQL